MIRKVAIGILARQKVQDALALYERIFSNAHTSASHALFVRPSNSLSCQPYMSSASMRHFTVLSSNSAVSDEIPQQSSVSTAKNDKNSMDFPGGRVPFTDRLSFVGGAMSPSQPTSCYRTLDSTGVCTRPTTNPSTSPYNTYFAVTHRVSMLRHAQQSVFALPQEPALWRQRCRMKSMRSCL